LLSSNRRICTNLTFATKFQPITLAGDRNRTKINIRSVCAVDLNFFLACRLALSDCRQIHKRKAHSALELVSAIPNQENNRAVGIDTFNWTSVAVRLAVFEKSKNLTLIGDHVRER
jgi:hypothetical protein